MRITIGQVLALNRCPYYPDERVLELAAGRKWVHHRTVAKMHMPQIDKLWLLISFMTHGQRLEFARRCALDVAHLWDAPDVVRRFLETGDESLRYAAWDAARATTWDVARDADWDAALNAAWAATRASSWATARATARDTAWVAAKSASRAAAWAVALDADSDAAREAAYDKYIGWCVEYLEEKGGEE
jgi:hypothetical protein